MQRLTPADLRDRMRVVLMRYTPDQLKRTPTDKLLAELADTFADLDIIGSIRMRDHHHSTGNDPATRAAIARKRLNDEALERVARESTCVRSPGRT